MSGTTAPDAATTTSGDDAPAAATDATTNMAENNNNANETSNAMTNDDIDTSIHVKVTAPFARSFVWLLVFIGFVLAAVSLRSCNFLEVNNISDTTSQPIYFGFYRLQSPSTNVCVLYPSSSLPLSSVHNAAGAMGIVATITSGIVWLSMMIMVCKQLSPICWTICNCVLALSFITESLQFIMFADPTCLSDEVQCRLGQGGAISVASMLFLLVGTTLMCIMKPPSEPAFELDLSDVLKDSSNSEQHFLGIIISKKPTQTTTGDLETGRGRSHRGVTVNNNHPSTTGSSGPLDLDGRTTAMVKGSSNKLATSPSTSKRGGLSAGASAAMLSAKSLFGKKQSSPSSRGKKQASQSQSQSQQPSLEQASQTGPGASSSNLNASSARAQSARGRGAFDLSNMLLAASDDNNMDAAQAPTTAADTGIPHISTNPTTSSEDQPPQPYPPAAAFVPDSVDF